MSEGERIISRACRLLQAGKARSWSHAIAIAAETVKRAEPTTTTTAAPAAAQQ